MPTFFGLLPTPPMYTRSFRLSMEEWVPGCRIIYDKFHILQHANDAVDEVRRAEVFPKVREMRGGVKGEKGLLLGPWHEPAENRRGRLHHVFHLNLRGVSRDFSYQKLATALL